MRKDVYKRQELSQIVRNQKMPYKWQTIKMKNKQLNNQKNKKKKKCTMKNED